MEKLAHRLAAEIAQSLGYDAERQAVVAYGLIAMIQILTTVFLVLILGILIHAPVEALIVCFSVSVLRKYSGGAHADSAELCTLIGVAYSTVAAFLSSSLLLTQYQPLVMAVTVIMVYSVSFFILWNRAPVDSPNKPIRTEAKRNKMKRVSIGVLIGYLALSIFFLTLGHCINIYNSFGMSLLFGVVWQIFTLTSPGASVLQRMNTFSLRRR